MTTSDHPQPSPAWAPPMPTTILTPTTTHTPAPVRLDGDIYARARALGVLLPPLPPPDIAAIAATATPLQAAMSDTAASIDASRPEAENQVPDDPRSTKLGRDYTKVWLATAISRTGDGITQAALPLLTLRLTGDVRHVAWVYAMTRVPWLGVSLFAGALADRFNRRTMLLLSDLSRLVLLGALGAVALGGNVQVWMLYIVGLGIGIGETFYESANEAVIPSIVHEHQYERASGRLSAAEITAYDLVGPALGALLFSFGVGLPFLVDAATFCVGSYLLYSLHNNFRDESVAAPPSASIVGDIRSGLRWLWRQPTLRALALLTGGVNFALQCTFAPLAVFSAKVLGMEDWGFGIMLAGASVGSILGGLFAGRLSAQLGPARTVRIALLGIGISVIAAGSMSNAVAAVAILTLVGAAMVLYQVVSVSTRMAAVPDHLRGRVGGAYILLSSFGGPIGAGFGGLVASQFGLRAPFFFGGGIALVLLVAFARPLSDTRLRAARQRIDLTDSASTAPPASMDTGPGARHPAGATNSTGSSLPA